MEARSGLVARIGVDEHRALGVKRDGQLEGEVPPRIAAGAPVHAHGQEFAIQPKRLERTDLLGLGREPRQVRVLDHVVEREQAPHQHLGRGDPAVADVLGPERPVDCAPADPADFPAVEGVFGRQPPLGDVLHEAERLEAIDPEPVGDLISGEHAAVEADERDPLGLLSPPAERLERLLAALQMHDHRSSPVTSARSAWR